MFLNIYCISNKKRVDYPTLNFIKCTHFLNCSLIFNALYRYRKLKYMENIIIEIKGNHLTLGLLIGSLYTRQKRLKY